MRVPALAGSWRLIRFEYRFELRTGPLAVEGKPAVGVLIWERLY